MSDVFRAFNRKMAGSGGNRLRAAASVGVDVELDEAVQAWPEPIERSFARRVA